MKKFLEYFLVVLLVLVSGNPVVSNRFVYPVLGIAGLAFIISRMRGKDARILSAYIGCFCLLFFGQYLVLGALSVLGAANHICKLLSGVAVLLFVGENFRDRFLDVMAAMAGVSLVFYICQLCGLMVPDLFPTSSENLHSVLIHNVNIARDEYLRNSGPFWEPGAFFGLLFLSLILYLGDMRELVFNRPLHTGLILAAIVTTRSTGGYICTSLLIAFFLIVVMYRNKWWYYLSVVAVLAAGLALFMYVPFMGDKIVHQFEISRQQMKYEDKPEYFESRSGSLVVDMYYVGKHPVVGNGFREETRFVDHEEYWDRIRDGHSNGFSNLFAQFGIPMALLYFVLLYFRLPFKEYRKWVFLLLYILLLQEEQFLNFPLFIALPFIILPKVCPQPSQAC